MTVPFLNSHVVWSGGQKRTVRPRVTVIVPLFNYASYVEETLESVYNQTLPEIDLVIVDDKSTDSSQDVAKSWIERRYKRFNRCTLVSNDHNFGLSATRNKALEFVETEYFFALDADNQIYPSALEKLLSAVDASGAQAAYSQLEIFGESHDVGEAYVWDTERLIHGNYIDAMALFSVSSVQTCGGYHQFDRDGWEDFDLWCGFADRGFVATFVPQILCRYRVHASSMLRAETNPSINSIALEIVARHPWLRIAF